MRHTSFALLLGALALGGCDDSNLIIVDRFAAPSTFFLRTVDGNVLPVVVERQTDPPIELAVISGSFTMHADGAFSTVQLYERTVDDLVSTVEVRCSGTWSVANRVITFVETPISVNCGQTFTGTRSGSTLTTSFRGHTAVWIR